MSALVQKANSKPFVFGNVKSGNCIVMTPGDANVPAQYDELSVVSDNWRVANITLIRIIVDCRPDISVQIIQLSVWMIRPSK